MLPMNARRWRPTPFLYGSLALHLAALLACLIQTHNWPWALACVISNHIAIAIIGLLPRSTWLGPTITRLPDTAIQRREVALTIDDGPDPEVTPKVLEILARYQAKATFFCIGRRAKTHPALVQAIIAAGHAVENHGQHHHTFNAMNGTPGWLREIEEGARSITAITGTAPLFYRPTAGLRNPLLDPVLCTLGMHLASWTRRGYDTRCKDPHTVLARLNRNLAPGDILLLHDGHAARTAQGVPVILEVLPALLKAFATQGLHPVTLRDAFDEFKTP